MSVLLGHRHSRSGVGTVVAVVCAIAACASPPASEQLHLARRAYDTARASPASRFAPEALDRASRALAAADRADAEAPGSRQALHLAYLAERRARLALVRGETAAAQQALARRARSAVPAEPMTAPPGTARDDARVAPEAPAPAVASELLRELRQMVDVQVGSDELVVVVPGAVLFDPGQSALLLAAVEPLTAIAQLLLHVYPGAAVRVEGHTDARGPAAYNQRLSEQRASRVKRFFVDQGVARDRLHDEGHGESQPIASNASAEGRAKNRRIRLVIAITRQPDA